MFNFTICNGPRQVIGVEVTGINKEQGAFWVKGNQYNSDLGQWVEVPLALRVGPFALPKLDKINVGDTILVKMTYDEGSNQVGTAEEIGLKGETIITYSAKQNKKYVTFSKVNRIQVFQKKDSSEKQSIQLSFKNPINAKDGTKLGEEYKKTNDQGQEITSYWINSSLFFNSMYENAYTAEKAEAEIGQGDTIICVTTEKPNKNNPEKMNYSCNKFLMVEKAAVQPAVVSNPFPEIPGVQSPVISEGQLLNQAPAPQPTAQVPTMPSTPQPTTQVPTMPNVPQPQPQLTPAPQPQLTPQPQMAQVPTPAPTPAPTAQVPVAPVAQATTPVAPVAPVAPTMAAPQMPTGLPANFAAQLPFN